MKCKIFMLFFISISLSSGPLLSGTARSHGREVKGRGLSDITEGSLVIIKEEGEISPFPLKHTDVEARVIGTIADVEVRQTFQNPFEDKIEAVYVFPLPENSAVNRMEIKVGERLIRGTLKERLEAERIYQEALKAGKTAALLSQERPNIFTQKVGNIMPGEEIGVKIGYIQEIAYNYGSYEFNFPMVVGPRYIPGNPTARSGGGFSPDTDRVPDASLITPPVMKPGTRSGHDISLSLSIEAGLPIKDWETPSHDVEVKAISEKKGRLEVNLKPHDSIPNKDFIFYYRVAGERIEPSLVSRYTDKGGFFLLTLYPSWKTPQDEITRREMIFLIDASGSMSGSPIEKAKEAVRQCLKNLISGDKFNIVTFNYNATKFRESSVMATPENVRYGINFVNNVQGNGGTEMLSGIKAALQGEAEKGRMRMVLLLTDGYIGNEAEIIHEVEKDGGRARVFAFGVGSSVNRYLLQKVAKVGKGAVEFVRPDEKSEPAVERFRKRMERPCLTDISVAWEGVEVEELHPVVIGDLYEGQPLTLTGRYEKGGKGKVTINGKVGKRTVEIPLKIHLATEKGEDHSISHLWAREEIEGMEDLMFGKKDDNLIEEITALSLEFSVLSHYTSFVAVEERVIKEPGREPRRVEVAVEMPDMVSYEGVFGEVAGGGGFMPSAGTRARSSADSPLPSLQRKSCRLTVPFREDDSERKGGGPLWPSIDIENIEIMGGLKTDQVEKSIKERVFRLIGSLNESIEVKVSLRVNREGRVTKVERLGQARGKGPDLSRLVRILKTVRFGPVKGGATITFRIKIK